MPIRPIRLHELRAAAEDLAGATRESLGFAQRDYLERRRLRSESDRFKKAWDKASFIGGWLRRPEAELLFELAAAVAPDRDIVEVGSYLGRSTAFLGQGAGAGPTIHAVDPHNRGRLQPGEMVEVIDTSKQFLQNMAEVGVSDRVEAHIEVSVDAARSYDGRPIGLLFIDARHTEEAVYEDGSVWAPHLAAGALIAFDDIDKVKVRRGVTRLVADGVVPAIAGHVGKIGVCGPRDRWPARVQTISRKD
jgi:predicted O-methyltransferase YrrM